MQSAKERPSDEADRRQLDLAQQEGRAYQASLDYMAKEVADGGAKTTAGDFIIGIAQEKAEGMWEPDAQGDLVWRKPEDKNCHLEVSVSDRGDGRFVPELAIQAWLTPENGPRLGPFEMPFLWHPGLYHYGRNLKLPKGGRYDIEVRIEAPQFHRHDRKNGNRYAKPVEVTFAGFEIKTGSE